MKDFAHPFGEAVPGEAVVSHGPVLDDGFRPRRRRMRDASNRWIYSEALEKEQAAMTTALAERTAEPMPKDQIDLIRRTVANGATNDELALFLYDCQRRGIHPLDKLLHFTKRGGKYTPVTSIDFMRAQAAMSGEMAGSDDPTFTMDGEKLVAATVTVYRLTQGQRFAYAATARWSEYCPDNAQMWRRMPHTMLGKCAEALALRKAFPQQLAGLYSTEEMQQADIQPREVAQSVERASEKREVAGSTPALPAILDDGPDLGTADDEQERERDWPPGFRLIDDITTSGDFTCVTWGRDDKGGWMIFKTKIAKIAQAARDAYAAHEPVLLHSNKPPYLDKVERLS